MGLIFVRDVECYRTYFAFLDMIGTLDRFLPCLLWKDRGKSLISVRLMWFRHKLGGCMNGIATCASQYGYVVYGVVLFFGGTDVLLGNYDTL